jgi:hypothetical protein|nr:MAG TPA: cysteine-rich protein [Caudoviricetes sp.]
MFNRKHRKVRYVKCPYCGYQPGENQPLITDPFYCEFGSM